MATLSAHLETTNDSHAPFSPSLHTPLPGPLAAKIMEEDQSIISPSYTRGYPLVVKSGRGSWIEDVDGNQFLDFTSGIAVASTGHCHPEVVKAIQDQASQLIHMSGTDFYYEQMPKLAQRLSAIAPMPGRIACTTATRARKQSSVRSSWPVITRDGSTSSAF